MLLRVRRTVLCPERPPDGGRDLSTEKSLCDAGEREEEMRDGGVANLFGYETEVWVTQLRAVTVVEPHTLSILPAVFACVRSTSLVVLSHSCFSPCGLPVARKRS